MISLFNDKDSNDKSENQCKYRKKDVNSGKNKDESNKNSIKKFLTMIKIIQIIWLFFSSFRNLNFTQSSFTLVRRLLIDSMFLAAKTSINLIMLPMRISKLCFKLLFFFFILNLLNFTLSKKHSKTDSDSKTMATNNQNFFENIQKEYSTFLKHYEKDSCIMRVFNNAKLNCDSEKTEEINKLFAYKMTECFYNSVGKTLPECKDAKSLQEHVDSGSLLENSIKIKKCISKLKGDAWTTFINFQNHIDNLCFFHKTLIWEKSSEFVYSKMLNSTIGILAELSHGSNLAKRILLEQEKFSSQLKDNMTDTLEEFKKIQTYFESFEKLEAKIKNDMLFIEEKMTKNNQHLLHTLRKLSSNLHYIDGFFFNKNGDFILKFYVFLIIYTFIFTLNANVNRFKFRLLLIILFFLCCEKFLFKGDNKSAKETDFYNVNKDLLEFDFKLQEDFFRNDNPRNNFHDEVNNNLFNRSQASKENFEIFERLKLGFATLLNSTFTLDNFIAREKDGLFSLTRFESFLYTFYLYFYRLVCFFILNIICCILKGVNKKEKEKNYFEKILLSDKIKGYINNLSNSKGSITPLWMKKYFSRIQDKNEELVEKFKLLKTKLDKGNNSLAATPSFKY